jgi:hypothetical protein
VGGEEWSLGSPGVGGDGTAQIVRGKLGSRSVGGLRNQVRRGFFQQKPSASAPTMVMHAGVVTLLRVSLRLLSQHYGSG